MLRVAEHLVQLDGKDLALRVADLPAAVRLDQHVRRVHPVERLVGAAVGVDRDAAVGLDHHESRGLGKGGVQSALVDHTATCHEESHGE